MSIKDALLEGLGYGFLAIVAVREGFAGEKRVRIYNSDTFIELKRGFFYDRVVYDTNRDGGERTFVRSLRPIYVKPVRDMPRPSKNYD